MIEKNQTLPVESNTAVVEPKLTWESPNFSELDFKGTESGGAAGPEGNIGGFPVGTQS